MVKVIEATPKVIDTLKKANTLVNSGKVIDQAPPNRVNTTRLEASMNIGNQLVPAKVVSGNGITGYLCDIYGAGLGEAPTNQGTVFLANGASSVFSLPVGTIIYVQKYPIVVHGGVS